jgi:hypothetical protein
LTAIVVFTLLQLCLPRNYLYSLSQAYFPSMHIETSQFYCQYVWLQLSLLWGKPRKGNVEDQRYRGAQILKSDGTTQIIMTNGKAMVNKQTGPSQQFLGPLCKQDTKGTPI